MQKTLPWAKREGDEEITLGRWVRLVAVGKVCVILIGKAPVRRIERTDRVSLRIELASLVDAGLVTQGEVARSGVVAEATFHRDCVAFREGGVAGVLARSVRGCRGPRKLRAKVIQEIGRLHGEGKTRGEIARQMGMSERSVGRALEGLMPDDSGQTDLDLGSETSTAPEVEEPPAACSPSDEASPAIAPGTEPGSLEATSEAAQVESARAPGATSPSALSVELQRGIEQFMARMGRIEEQSALFPTIPHARYAGALLALALLPVTGLLPAVRTHLGRLPNGFYGVRSMVTILVTMALLRCKRPEQLKGFNPQDLGAIVGLARAPEMKTVRCKFGMLARDEEKVIALVRDMAKRHAERLKDLLGFLYVDGHVRPYFGKTVLGKAHSATLHMVLPATTDYWVSAAHGEPLLVITVEGNAALTRALPFVLDEVRTLVGPDARRTVVFDRGGWSPALFKQIRARGFDFLTYRKGKCRPFPKSAFHTIQVRRGGRERPTLVCDRRVRVKGFGLLRCVAVLRDDGRQTHVLTTRDDLTTREVLERMFSRWQQENFFKYMDEQYAFDALWFYDTVEADPDRTVPSPYRRLLDQQIDTRKRERARLLGMAKNAGQVSDRVEQLDDEIRRLRSMKSILPPRVPVSQARNDGEVLELVRAPMLLGDVIKMTAYHLETMLLAAVAPHLRRADDEGRAFLADVMHLDGSLQPTPTHLLVTLKPPSAPRYVHALRALCDHVNALDPCFPETSTRLRFQVADPVVIPA